MPVEKERPRPHGDKLEDAIPRNPEENRAQSQSDATPEEMPTAGGRTADPRELSDRARGRGSDANGIPEFDEDAGRRRRKQYDDGAELVSGID
jgi:hypothetical protein